MKKYRFLLLICLVFIITGCSFSVEVNKKSISNKDNTSEIIPNIVGLTEEDATSILELNGFETGEVFLINDDKENWKKNISICAIGLIPQIKFIMHSFVQTPHFLLIHRHHQILPFPE